MRRERVRGEGAPRARSALQGPRPRRDGRPEARRSAARRLRGRGRTALPPLVAPAAGRVWPPGFLGRAGFLWLVSAGGMASQKAATLSSPPAARASARNDAVSSFPPGSAPLPERKAWQSPSRSGRAVGPAPAGASLPPVAPPGREPSRAAPPVPVTGAGRGPVNVQAGGSPPPVARMVRAASRTGPGRWPLAAPATPPAASAPAHHHRQPGPATPPSPGRRAGGGGGGRPSPGNGPQLSQDRRPADELQGLGAATAAASNRATSA